MLKQALEAQKILNKNLAKQGLSEKVSGFQTKEVDTKDELNDPDLVYAYYSAHSPYRAERQPIEKRQGSRSLPILSEYPLTQEMPIAPRTKSAPIPIPSPSPHNRYKSTFEGREAGLYHSYESTQARAGLFFSFDDNRSPAISIEESDKHCCALDLAPMSPLELGPTQLKY